MKIKIIGLFFSLLAIFAISAYTVVFALGSAQQDINIAESLGIEGEFIRAIAEDRVEICGYELLLELLESRDRQTDSEQREIVEMIINYVQGSLLDGDTFYEVGFIRPIR